MIVKRLKFQKLLYLHGKDEEVKYPGGGLIYTTLKKYFNIDFLNYPSHPIKGYDVVKNFNFSDYKLVIGFSLGGVMASLQNETPIFLINPGFGFSVGFPEFKRIDKESNSINPELVERVLVGKNDKYSGIFLPEINNRGLSDKIQYIPSKHVPTEEEIKKYIVPEVKKILKRL